MRPQKPAASCSSASGGGAPHCRTKYTQPRRYPVAWPLQRKIALHRTVETDRSVVLKVAVTRCVLICFDTRQPITLREYRSRMIQRQTQLVLTLSSVE